MKKILIDFNLTLLITLLSVNSFAQDDQIRNEINELEQKGKQAILQKDSATLNKLWSPGLIVNSPTNIVVKGGQVELVMSGRISYTLFTCEMENLQVIGDIVITMGRETVIPSPGNKNAGQTIERRYTNVWQKKNGSWLLISRHANEICK